MNLAEKLKERHNQNRVRVLALLQYSDVQLSQMIFDSAYTYLENVFDANAYGMEHLPRTKEFWTWWRLEWGKIDSIFLAAVEESDRRDAMFRVRDRERSNSYRIIRTLGELRDEYAFYHEASSTNRYMNDHIVRAGAREMMSAIMKDAKQTI